MAQTLYKFSEVKYNGDITVAGGFPHPKQGVIMKKTIITIIVLAALVGVLALSLTACEPTEKVVVVGYTIYEPMNYFENNELVGFDTELAKAVFQELGYTVEFKEINWDNKYIDLNSGNIDCIWNGFTSNGAEDDGTPKSNLVDFSYKYMVNRQCVVVQSSNNATTFDELNNKAVTGVAESGSAGEDYIESNISDCTLKTAPTQMTAINEVNAGTCTFAVVDFLLANSIIGQGNFANLKIINELNSEDEQYAIGFRKGDDLRNKVNEVLQKFLEDGTTRGIAEKYGLENAIITDYSVLG